MTPTETEKQLRAKIANLEVSLEMALRDVAELTPVWADDDEDNLTPLIRDDYTMDGFWRRYDVAMKYVGNRRSKGALVCLVAFLLKGNPQIGGWNE